MKRAVDHERVKEIRKRDQNCRAVAEAADLLRKLTEAHLERAFPLVHLHLLGDLPEKGRVTHGKHTKFSLARQHRASAKDRAFRTRRACAIRARLLLNLTVLARHRGLIDGKLSADHIRIGGDLLPRANEDHVADDDLVDRHLTHRTVAPYTKAPLPVKLRKTRKRRLTPPLRNRRYKSGKKYRDGNPHRLQHVTAPKHKKEVDHKRAEQNADHGISEIGEKMRQKAPFFGLT